METSEGVTAVNDRMKEVVKHVGKFDRVCCDLFCIALMVALIILIVKIEEGETVEDEKEDNSSGTRMLTSFLRGFNVQLDVLNP